MPGSPALPADQKRLAYSQRLMTHQNYILDKPRRTSVLAGLHQACENRGWTLLAAHCRSNRALKQIDGDNRKRWARHGSTRYLWTREQMERAIRYVVEGQGELMEVYCRG